MLQSVCCAAHRIPAVSVSRESTLCSGSRIAATMLAAISKAPFSRCWSMAYSEGDDKAKVERRDTV
jgi:hypothetical protein